MKLSEQPTDRFPLKRLLEIPRNNVVCGDMFQTYDDETAKDFTFTLRGPSTGILNIPSMHPEDIQDVRSIITVEHIVLRTDTHTIAYIKEWPMQASGHSAGHSSGEQKGENVERPAMWPPKV